MKYRNTALTGDPNEETAPVTRGRRGAPYAVEHLEARVLLSANAIEMMAPFGVNVTGVMPSGALTVDAAGNVYGTTLEGGSHTLGTIFEIPRGGSTITTLASFSNSFRSGTKLIVDGSGNLYGWTETFNSGSLFELHHGTSDIQILGSVDAPIDGNTLVRDGQGNLYGQADIPSPGYPSAIVELAAGSSSIIPIAPLSSRLSGELVIDGIGNLYGAEGQSVVELPAGGTALTPLFTFPNGTTPQMIGSDGTGHLYGLAFENQMGVIFRINPDGSGFTNLVPLPARGLISLVDGAGDVFGIAEAANPTNGNPYFQSIFELPQNGTTIITLASFGGTSNDVHPATMVMDGQGDLYGTTAEGGEGAGTVFELAAGGSAITTSATFDLIINNGNGLIAGKDGTLYGTTDGDVLDLESVYKIPLGGSGFEPIAVFNNYPEPVGQIVMDSYGNIFGVTYFGGTSGDGSIYELPAGSSTIVTLASFTGSNGWYPAAGIIMDNLGNLFGTTSGGGASGWGTVFELAAGSNAITTLASFAGSDGKYPSGQIAIDANGNLYGTTETGGANRLGTVFEIASGSSTITTLFSFNSSLYNYNPFVNNDSPLPVGLVLDANGNVIVTAKLGGSAGGGAVIEIAPGSLAVTTLASFPAGDGEGPTEDLLLDSNGNLYGTTQGNSVSGPTLFEIPSGSSSVITTPLNAVSEGPLAEDHLGNVYGISSGLFKLSSIPTGDTIVGAAAADNITLVQDPDHHNIDWSINGASPSVLPINDINGLTINGNGGDDTITLDYSNGNPLPATLHLNGTFTIDGLQGADPFAGRTLDIGQSTAYLNYGTPSNDPIFAIRQYLQTGYNGGTWTGTPASAIDGAITSSAAQTNPGYMVGYADSADGVVPGQPANTVELKYILAGDLTLAGTVNFADFAKVIADYGKPASWDGGTVTYDSTVSFADFALVVADYGKQAVTSVVSATLAASAVNASPLSASDDSSGKASPRLFPAVQATAPVDPVAHHPQPANVAVRKRR